MPKADIVKQGAQSLPDHLRRMVVQKCREQAKVSGLTIFLFLITSAIFIGGGIAAVIISGRKLSAIMLTVFFAAVSLFVEHLSFVKPHRLLKMAEADRYECCIGRLTDKSSLKGDDETYYQLVLNDAVKCGCTKEQYDQAKPGEEYMAVFFGRESPEFFLKLSNKDMI